MNCTSLTKSNSQTSDTSCSIEKYETASKSLNKTIRIDKRQSTLSSSNQDELSNVINVVHGNVQSNDYKTKNFLNRFDSTYTNQESNRSNCQDIKINTDIPIQNIENTQNFEPTPKKIQKSTISSIMPDSVNVPEPSYEIDEYKNKKESSGNGKTPVKTNQKHMNQNIKKPKSEFKNAKNSKDRVTTLNPNFTSEISLCIKYFLFAFNTIFFISGIFLFVVLVILIVKRDILSDLYDVSQFNSASFIKFDPLVLIIFICLFIVIIAFAGCIGALRENIFFLNMYSISLVSILVVFIIMSFIPIVFKNSGINYINSTLKSLIKLYVDRPTAQDLMDQIQGSLFSCCGINGMNDWDLNDYYNCNSTESIFWCGVPHSCCSKPFIEDDHDIDNYLCGSGVRLQKNKKMLGKIYIQGCLPSITNFINTFILPIAIVCIVVTVIMLSGAFFAQRLKKQVMRQKKR